MKLSCLISIVSALLVRIESYLIVNPDVDPPFPEEFSPLVFDDNTLEDFFKFPTSQDFETHFENFMKFQAKRTDAKTELESVSDFESKDMKKDVLNIDGGVVNPDHPETEPKNSDTEIIDSRKDTIPTDDQADTHHEVNQTLINYPSDQDSPKTVGVDISLSSTTDEDVPLLDIYLDFDTNQDKLMDSETQDLNQKPQINQQSQVKKISVVKGEDMPMTGDVPLKLVNKKPDDYLAKLNENENNILLNAIKKELNSFDENKTSIVFIIVKKLFRVDRNRQNSDDDDDNYSFSAFLFESAPTALFATLCLIFVVSSFVLCINMIFRRRGYAFLVEDDKAHYIVDE